MEPASSRHGARPITLAVRVGTHARLVWASLDDVDFNTIDDLVLHLIELDNTGQLHTLDATPIPGGPYDIRVVVAQHMTAAITTQPEVVLYAIGRPT